MNQWTDRIRDHPVWQNMKNLGPAIDRAEDRESIDPQSVDGLERVRGILTFAGKRLAGADTQLLYLVPLDGIASSLQNAISEIEEFAANGDVSRIANANSQADTILSHLPAINYPFVKDDWNALRDAGLAYRDALKRNLQHVQTAL